ncbi:hypothetical protein BDA99DRAFT_605742 [Phascolomyces articulosus]|uniref:Arrestin C-terminal-like domain-containing protein n=1 Tax=Phascolomyces articulosus TaxID=60185 RepID=A0AAD5K8R8_9FUNG|nr:hypothetical protein BDA99DRAFT_605742 [Phascolomyces articulosus]
MRHLTKGNSKTIDIRLNEEKFYFPGETIKGVVIIHPKSPTKTNHITLRFTGEVFLSIKDKETIILFQKTVTIAVSNDRGKTHVLDAKQHNFDFEFVVPDDLPSAMEFGKRKARIRYLLTAIHDRPMVPESLCAKSEYTVPILEFVDVQSPQYNKIQEQSLDFVIPQISKRHQQCQLRVSMPKFGFTRGDLVKLSIVFNHYESFTREKALRVDLIRKVDIRTNKNTFGKEDVLKSVDHDINIIGPYNFSQAINSQILIPTSTPPTIRYKDKVIDIHYKILIRLYLEKKKTVESQCLEMPIVIGTWPKADVPIDDEDDDDYYEEDRVVSDSDDDDIIRRDSDFSLPPPPQPTQSKSSTTYQPQHRRNVSSSMLSVGSASTVTLTLRNTHINDQQAGGVVRSDSNASHSSRRSQGSERSWRSSQSYDQRSPTLSRNTSASTNLTTPDAYYSSAGRNIIVTAGSQTYLNRSSSTPDLLNNPPIPPPSATPSGSVFSTIRPNTNTTTNTNNNNRTSYYDATSNFDYAQQQQPYPRTTSYQQQYQTRQTSNDYNSTTTTINVPTHVLQPLPSSSSNYGYTNQRSPVNNVQSKPRMPHRNYDYSFYDDSTDSETESNNNTNNNNQIPLSSDDSDDSDDDGDLLRIIEKKKKKEERARRARGHY